MNSIDPYIFHFIIFSPLAASMLITLIPTVDLGSKLVISRFFAIAGFVAFVRLFFLFVNQSMPIETSLSFALANFHITFALFLTKYNIFLYGAASAILMANMSLQVVNDIKSNIHQVAPFVLTFILYISFGQNDLRVALPVLSIANFLVYYLIGNSEKMKRGSTIFQMGIFLFSCDAMVLVLLQIPYSNNLSEMSTTLFAVLLMTPALSRLCLPMFAPFMKRLLLNVGDSEGPFLMSFLQLSGILILIFVKRDLDNLSLSICISIATLIGAIFITLLAIYDRKTTTLPYYFLLFYSSFGCMILFISKSSDIWYFSISLLLTNIACFFHAARCALLSRGMITQSYDQQFTSIWFITLTLMAGLPGFGIGTSLWGMIYWLITSDHIQILHSFSGFWLIICLGWLLGLMLLSFALILSVRDDIQVESSFETGSLTNRLPIFRSLLLATCFVALVSWIIPLAIFYAATKGPK